ncbi:hypothetical protein HAX54_007907, partial [Datura stramonium]|nr:hypothetical protein [Datura stramonium]
MASKGKEVVPAQPRFKRLRKGPKGASSSIAKEAKYAPRNWIDDGRLVLELPTIKEKLHELGVGYIFGEPLECNLTLVREFYVNWDTTFGGSTKVKIRGQVVQFTHKRFNAFLGTPK